jgi:predicted PurR-regulated permease PerM
VDAAIPDGELTVRAANENRPMGDSPMPDAGLALEAEAAVATTPAASTSRLHTFLLLAICLMLACYTMYVARILILPILVAILLKLVLARGANARADSHSRAVGAGVLTMLALGVTYGTYALSAPATEWVTKIPERLFILRSHLRHIKEPIEYIQQAGRSIYQLSEIATPAAPADANAAEQPTIVSNDVDVQSILLSETATLVTSMGSMLVLLYFLLAAGDLFLRKLVAVLPTFRDKKQAVEIAHQVQNDVSHYLLTITIINTVLGIVVGGVLNLIGMPSPWLWGAMVGIFNFVPFIGPAVCLGIITLVSFMSFPEWQNALLPPLVVLGLCTLEGQFITPMILARRLLLNPVAVFIALMFCGWLWGVVGILISVPLLAVFKSLRSFALGPWAISHPLSHR